MAIRLAGSCRIGRMGHVNGAIMTQWNGRDPFYIHHNTARAEFGDYHWFDLHESTWALKRYQGEPESAGVLKMNVPCLENRRFWNRSKKERYHSRKANKVRIDLNETQTIIVRWCHCTDLTFHRFARRFARQLTCVANHRYQVVPVWNPYDDEDPTPVLRRLNKRGGVTTEKARVIWRPTDELSFYEVPFEWHYFLIKTKCTLCGRSAYDQAEAFEYQHARRFRTDPRRPELIDAINEFMSWIPLIDRYSCDSESCLHWHIRYALEWSVDEFTSIENERDRLCKLRDKILSERKSARKNLRGLREELRKVKRQLRNPQSREAQKWLEKG